MLQSRRQGPHRGRRDGSATAPTKLTSQPVRVPFRSDHACSPPRAMDLHFDNNRVSMTFGSGPHRLRSAILTLWCSGPFGCGLRRLERRSPQRRPSPREAGRGIRGLGQDPLRHRQLWDEPQSSRSSARREDSCGRRRGHGRAPPRCPDHLGTAELTFIRVEHRSSCARISGQVLAWRPGSAGSLASTRSSR